MIHDHSMMIECKVSGNLMCEIKKILRPNEQTAKLQNDLRVRRKQEKEVNLCVT